MSTVESQDTSLNATAAAMLGLLRQYGSMNANALTNTARETIGDYWTLTRSQVYRELATLASKGFVRFGPAGPRDSRDIVVTDAGEREFLTWLQQGPANELIRMPLMLTVRFGRELDDQRFQAILSDFTRRHREKLQHYELLQSGAIGQPVDKYEIATLRFGILFEQTIQTWLEELHELLDDPDQ